jgi:curved DNA-binding protein
MNPTGSRGEGKMADHAVAGPAAMAAGDRYAVLGVPRTETAAGIRAAFHALADRFGPHQLGRGAERVLSGLSDAYAVLSDPERRRAHDRELSGRRELRSHRDDLDRPSAPISLLGDPASVHPSVAALQDRLARNFTGRGVSKGERAEPLLLDVACGADEAVPGVWLRIGVPIWEEAPDAYVMRERILPVRIPALVRSGTVIDVALDDLGIHNLYLHVRVHLTDQPTPPRA